MPTPPTSIAKVIFIIMLLVVERNVESFTLNNVQQHGSNRRKMTKLKSTNGMDVDAPTSFMNVFTTVYDKDNNASPETSSPIKRLRSTFEYAPNGVCIDPGLFVLDNGESEGSEERKKYFTMRNVPGNGDCMFLAVALAAATSMGLGGNDALLEAISKETREVVAQVLSSPNGTLYIANGQTCKAQALLQQATRGEGLGEDTDRYLELLRMPGVKGGIQGGGPELTVLANVLRRPISIYELATPMDEVGEDETGECLPNTYPIVCKGTFGLDLFGDPCATIPESAVLSGVQEGAYSWQLHILILDVSPKGDEKHACVLLPQTPI